MRVQVEVNREIKIAAEAQARDLGYPSLAVMLRVHTARFARDYQTATEEPSTPKQFKHWPTHIRSDLAAVDPPLYRFYIEHGIIN